MPDVTISVLDTSTSTKVGEGIDPTARAAFLAATATDPAPPPAPKFKAGQVVYHRASGEKVVVIGAIQPCGNPDHRQAHEDGARFDSLPDCEPVWSGHYVVSPDVGCHVHATESELVEVAGP